MNAEELRMVLDTIKDVAQTAGYAGSLWIVVHYLTTLVGSIVWPLAIAYGFIKAFGYIREVQLSYHSKPNADEVEKTKRARMELEKEVTRHQLKEIAAAAGMTSYYLSGLSDSEVAKLKAAVSVLNKKEQKA